MDRERTVDADTGRFTGWVGKLLPVDDGLCPVDARHARYAVNALNRDVLELGWAVRPNLAVVYRDEDFTDGGSHLEAPLPLKASPHALRDLIAQVCLDWCLALDIPGATALAEVSTGRLHEHIGGLTYGLQAGWDRLLTLPATEQPLRSATDNPTDGLRVFELPVRERYSTEYRVDDQPAPLGAEDLVTYSGSYWYRPDGTAAALLLLRLHEQAQRLCGTGTDDRPEPVPCPGCRRRGLVRRHSRHIVECVRCLDVRLTDDEYDRYLRTGRWAKETAK